MRRHFRCLAALLLLLLCLAACETQPDPAPTTLPTTVPTETTLPPETEPPIDPYALYEEAAAAIPDDLVMAVFIDRQIQVGDLLLESSAQQNITYLGRGTDDFRARVTDSNLYGGYSSAASETYVESVLYASTSNSYFSDEMTAEEFTARYVPPVLLDASLYESLEYDGKDTFTFSGATGLERWVLDGEAEIVSAEGTAIVANGTIVEATYSVTYLIGGTQISLEVEQMLGVPDNITIAAPSGNHSYRLVDSFDAIRSVDQVYGYLMAANTMEASIYQAVSSSYSNMALVQQYAVDVYDIGDDPMFQVDGSIAAVNLSNGMQQGAAFVQTFRNNMMQTSENGGRPVSDRSISRTMMRDYCQSLYRSVFPEIKYMEQAQVFDLGGLQVASIICDEKYSDLVTSSLCAMLYGEPDALEKQSSSFTGNPVEFYVTIDTNTGLPTAIGSSYSAVHTVYGREHTLGQDVTCSFSLPALDAYESITGELPEETEPEEKATPLLYHVTGPDGQEMWLFGTVHIGDSRTGFLPQEFYDAFIASDALALEFDTQAFREQLAEDPALNEELSKYYYYTDGTTAYDHFSDENLYLSGIMMLKATGLYNTNYLAMKPFLWSQDMSNVFLRLGNKLTGSKGMEARLQILADHYGKPILEVETALSQVQMITGFSDGLQELLLAQAIFTPVRDNWEASHELYELWCAGDEAALIEAFRQDTDEEIPEEFMEEYETVMALFEEYDKAMITDRNKAMTDVAIGYLESGDTVFFCVGLGHLLSEDGLVNVLREAGYTVELGQYK